MSENLRDLSSELSQVETAIHDAPLYADPNNPGAGFSDRLVDLVAQEDWWHKRRGAGPDHRPGPGGRLRHVVGGRSTPPLLPGSARLL